MNIASNVEVVHSRTCNRSKHVFPKKTLTRNSLRRKCQALEMTICNQIMSYQSLRDMSLRHINLIVCGKYKLARQAACEQTRRLAKKLGGLPTNQAACQPTQLRSLLSNLRIKSPRTKSQARFTRLTSILSSRSEQSRKRAGSSKVLRSNIELPAPPSSKRQSKGTDRLNCDGSLKVDTTALRVIFT